jgi:hypothetical protein
MENQNTNDNPAEPFGPVIYSYTRSQAMADGFQGANCFARSARLPLGT